MELQRKEYPALLVSHPHALPPSLGLPLMVCTDNAHPRPSRERPQRPRAAREPIERPDRRLAAGPASRRGAVRPGAAQACQQTPPG